MITHKTFTSPCSYQTVGPDVTFMWKNIFAIDLHQKQNPYSVFTTLQCKIIDLMFDIIALAVGLQILSATCVKI